jgi:tRNA nucleotidyltransferase (CCA-adding enzyme)
MSDFSAAVLPYQVSLVLERIMNNHGQAYIVGGAVRDLLLGKTVNDWDIATSLDPARIEEIFHDVGTIPTGKKFGTVTVVAGELFVEVTTYRGESSYIDYRHPEKIEYVNDIILDLGRRDFTMNALAFNPNYTVSLIDPYDGASDIENRIIRTVGNSIQRFSEDPLRIIRAVRFACQLGFSIDNETLNAIVKCRSKLKFISTERIRDEFNKILLDEHVLEGISLLKETRLISCIFPGIDDFSTQSMDILNNCDSDIILRLSALFCGNSGINVADVEISLDRLHYDRRTIDRVIRLIQSFGIWFNTPESTAAYQIRKLLGELGADDLFRLLSLHYFYVSCLSDNGKNRKLMYLDKIKHLTNEIISRNDPYLLSHLAINGFDVIEAGIGENDRKMIGKALKQAYEWVLHDPELNSREILMNKLREISL